MLDALLCQWLEAHIVAALISSFGQWSHATQLRRKCQQALSTRLSLIRQSRLHKSWSEWRVTLTGHQGRALRFAAKALDHLCLSGPFHAWHRAVLCAALAHDAAALRMPS